MIKVHLIRLITQDKNVGLLTLDTNETSVTEMAYFPINTFMH